MQPRTNRNNDGRALQTLIESIARQYEHDGLLRIRKVEPPLRYIAGKVQHLRNPFLDYIGSWTEQGGRMLAIEAKSTSEPKLPIVSSGVTANQIENLVQWKAAGAAVCVLWECKGNLVYVPLNAILHARESGRHLKFGWFSPVPQGLGFIMFDFLDPLRREFTPIVRAPEQQQPYARPSRSVRAV